MKLEEIEERDRFEYLGTCGKCGVVIKVLTQEDGNPEYYTDVYIMHCPGEFVHFDLPVN